MPSEELGDPESRLHLWDRLKMDVMGLPETLAFLLSPGHALHFNGRGLDDVQTCLLL